MCFLFWNIYECICFVSVFKLENVCLFLRWTRAQIKIYIFISSRLVSLNFGSSCCCNTFVKQLLIRQMVVLWDLGLCYVGITLVMLVLRWLCWYFVGSVGISLVMLALDIWLHILVTLYFTPTLSGRWNALPKKVPKELYKRKDSNR